MSERQPALLSHHSKCFAARLLAVVFLALAIANLASWFGHWHWLCDNLTAFTATFALASFVFVILFLTLKSRAGSIAATALLILNIIALSLGTHPGPRGELPQLQQLHIISTNVKTSNREFSRAIEYLRESNADVIIVIEVDDAWVNALRGLEDIYPHTIYEPRPDNFGIALLSRRPFSSQSIIRDGHAKLPSIVARMNFDGKPLTIIGTHPLPPVKRQTANARNHQLNFLAKFIQNERSGVILAGDLNVAPWSGVFQNFLEDANLSEARSPFDLSGTWPAFAPGLRARIDHILIMPTLSVVEADAGPNIGSDHLPIEARISW